MARILITDGMDKSAIAKLKELGHEVVEQFYESDDLGAAMCEFDAMVVRSKTKVRAPHIDAAAGSKMKLIIRGGVGVDNIDVAYAEEKGIAVRNTPCASSESVAEMALALMFGCARYVSVAGHSMREGKWEKKAYGKGSIMRLGDNSRVMVEAIPTWNGGEESVELYECYNFTEFDAQTVTEEIATRMREVRDRLAAKVPETKLSCPVVLGAPELARLLSSLAYELNYAGIYNHTAAFKEGDDIQKGAVGDRLTVTVCGAVKGSVRSAAFDADGTSLVDAEVIRDGVAVGSFGSARYASYLGKKPTGNLGCLRVETGSASDRDLARAPYFRCASMSGLQLDIYNDYIGGEVRLAYYFDGEKEIPVTGISISGKLSEALAHMRLSDTATVHEGYCGPRWASFDTIEIV